METGKSNGRETKGGGKVIWDEGECEMSSISTTTNIPGNLTHVLFSTMSLRSEIYSLVRRSDAKMPG